MAWSLRFPNVSYAIIVAKRTYLGSKEQLDAGFLGKMSHAVTIEVLGGKELQADTELEEDMT